MPKTVNSFKAGRLKDFAHNWEAITSDAWILKMIRGIDIEFDEPVRQSRPSRPILFVRHKKLRLLTLRLINLVKKE